MLIILCGLPSSGKSWFAKKLGDRLSKEFPKQKVNTLDIDILRRELFGETFLPENESFVRETAFIQTHEYLSKGAYLIVDDINYYNSMRHDFKKIADDNQAPYLILYISTPLEVCLEWNKNRKFPLDEKIIKNVFKKFDFPGKKYQWDCPFEQIDLSTENFEAKINTIIEQIKKLKFRDFIKTQNSQYCPSEKLIIDRLTRMFVNFYAQEVYDSPSKEVETETNSLFWNAVQISSKDPIFSEIRRKFLNNIGNLNTERKKYLEITQINKFNLSKDYSEKNLMQVLIDFMKYLIK